MYTYTHHIKVIWQKQKEMFILFHFDLFLLLAIVFGLGGMWEVSHGCGEANTFSFNTHHHFNKELPIHEKWKSCESLCWTKESEEDEYYPLSYTGNIFLLHSL